MPQTDETTNMNQISNNENIKFLSTQITSLVESYAETKVKHIQTRLQTQSDEMKRLHNQLYDERQKRYKLEKRVKAWYERVKLWFEGRSQAEGERSITPPPPPPSDVDVVMGTQEEEESALFEAIEESAVSEARRKKRARGSARSIVASVARSVPGKDAESSECPKKTRKILSDRESVRDQITIKKERTEEEQSNHQKISSCSSTRTETTKAQDEIPKHRKQVDISQESSSQESNSDSEQSTQFVFNKDEVERFQAKFEASIKREDDVMMSQPILTMDDTTSTSSKQNRKETSKKQPRNDVDNSIPTKREDYSSSQPIPSMIQDYFPPPEPLPKQRSAHKKSSHHPTSPSHSKLKMKPKHKPKSYKYQEVIRKQSIRRALPGHTCEHCRAFVNALCTGSNPVFDKKAMLKECSRHKCQYSPDPTPDGFWELSFADSIAKRRREDDDDDF